MTQFAGLEIGREAATTKQAGFFDDDERLKWLRLRAIRWSGYRGWRKLLETGAYATIDEMAAAKKINASYICRVLRLK